MIKLLRNKGTQSIIFSFGGQIAFLMSNFILFIYLAKNYSQESFGQWALFITTVSIADGFRQGFVQNGLSRMLIKSSFCSKTINSGLIINYLLIVLLSALFISYGAIVQNSASILFSNAFKALLALGSIQFANTLTQAQQNFKRYFRNNLIYFLVFVTGLTIQITLYGSPDFVRILDLMLISSFPILILTLKDYIKWSKPEKKMILELIQFGKYASGTNILSLLFQRVDILMIGYFLGPAPVAIFHFANKIMNYAELPLQALSQVIYPKISTSSHLKSGSQLNKTYGRSILWLFAFVFPIAMILILFNHTIIEIMGNEGFKQASMIIVIFSLASIFKPWGRVFGLTLDAVGKPRVNFLMLVFSLVVNITLNLLLIPTYGLIGGALATAIAIVSTIFIGQLKLRKELSIHPIQTVLDALKETLTTKKLSWN